MQTFDEGLVIVTRAAMSLRLADHRRSRFKVCKSSMLAFD